ncbi:hypothetical protein HK098_007712 [Nowakowskiella sp. JEL0407]|nr:hypothetical protein HK098_007712 [Nowakowskiella sp. JEL0407]
MEQKSANLKLQSQLKTKSQVLKKAYRTITAEDEETGNKKRKTTKPDYWDTMVHYFQGQKGMEGKSLGSGMGRELRKNPLQDLEPSYSDDELDFDNFYADNAYKPNENEENDSDDSGVEEEGTKCSQFGNFKHDGSIVSNSENIDTHSNNSHRSAKDKKPTKIDMNRALTDLGMVMRSGLEEISNSIRLMAGILKGVSVNNEIMMMRSKMKSGFEKLSSSLEALGETNTGNGCNDRNFG